MSKEPDHSYDHLLHRLPMVCDLGDDPTVQFKLFLPGEDWRWYVLSGHESCSDWILFVYATSPDCSEFGSVGLNELQSATGPLGQCVERDLYFKPVRVSKISSGEVQ